MFKEIVLYCFIAVTWFAAGRASVDSKRDNYLKIEDSITKEMKERPTKYKDEFSFGYNIGLIKCSSIVYGVLRK